MNEVNFGSEQMHAIDGVQDRRPVSPQGETPAVSLAGEAVLVRAICNSAGNKKEEQIQALVAAGFSQGQAKTLREKYMGNK